MNIVELVNNNIPSIVAIVLFVIIVITLIKAGQGEKVKEVILSLVVKSEAFWGSGTGEIKYAEVVAELYKVLPSIVIFFISEKELDKMIEDAVKYMKHCLENQKGIKIRRI